MFGDVAAVGGLPDDVGAPFDFLVRSFQRVGRDLFQCVGGTR
jgi:hypothetical protein